MKENRQRKWEEAGGKNNDINGVTQVNWHNLGQTWTNTLTYNLKFGRNNFDILGGIETYKFLNENMEGYTKGSVAGNQGICILSGRPGEQKFHGGGDDDQNRKLVSYFGKINYSFVANISCRLPFVAMALPYSVRTTVSEPSLHFLQDGESTAKNS